MPQDILEYIHENGCLPCERLVAPEGVKVKVVEVIVIVGIYVGKKYQEWERVHKITSPAETH